MATVLVTGANRGLGLEFCRQYAQDGWQVIACCRQPSDAFELNQLVVQHNNIRIFALDVSDFAQIEHLSVALSGAPIDVLISNAGVYGDCADHEFGHLNYDHWAKTLKINTMAPIKLAESLLPNLLKSRQPKLVAISSLMGSMSDNGSGGSILYRSSKAGLNAAMKSLSLDLKPYHVAVSILHPGWVQTRMGGDHAPTTPEESIAGMRQVIVALNLENSGKFINFKGKELPW